jgi:hypothetical protein
VNRIRGSGTGRFLCETNPRFLLSLEITKRTQGLLQSPGITKRTQGFRLSREIAKRTQGFRLSREITKRTQGLPLSREITKRTQGFLPSREITKRTQGLLLLREIAKRTQGPRDSGLLRERFDIQPSFAPVWAREGRRGGDVMDNIGEMARHSDVNGRVAIC